jgi:hypothetical protein
MKKETIKLTESRLRKLVEACVKEALEETMEEGATTDFISDVMKSDLSDEPMPTWEEFKTLVMGEPDRAKYLYNKLMYNQAKSGHIDNISKQTNIDYGAAAITSEPGFKGRAKRAAAVAALAGKIAFDKAKKSFKKEKPEDAGSFTL